MANIIKIKQSSVASRVPQPSDLEQGELAINTNDEKLYTKNSSGSVVELGKEVESINDIADVTVSSVADKQLLQYNSSTSKWENVTLPQFYETTTEPSSPNAGDTWYDESEGKIYMRVALNDNSGKWIEIGTEEVVNWDGGDSDQTAYTLEVSGGDASTSTYTEQVTGGSA